MSAKPKISKEARQRIRAFMRDIEAAQKLHGIELYVDSGMLNLFDTRRTDEWLCEDGSEYGQFDAFISEGRVSPRAVHIEDFSGWGK